PAGSPIPWSIRPGDPAGRPYQVQAAQAPRRCIKFRGTKLAMAERLGRLLPGAYLDQGAERDILGGGCAGDLKITAAAEAAGAAATTTRLTSAGKFNKYKR